MKKVLLTLSIAAIIGGTMPQAVSAAGIQDTPEGKEYDNMYRSSKQYLQMWGSLYVNNIEGKISSIVIDGKDFYMYKPVDTFGNSYPYWIKGTLGDDNLVVFTFPQDVYVVPANEYLGTPESQVSAKMAKVVTNGDVQEFVEDTENPNLVMKWENNTLTQVDAEIDGVPRIVGMYNSDGTFTGTGEGNINWNVFDTTLPTPPAGTETTQYVCNTTDAWGNVSNRIVEFGTAGDELWIKGLYGYFSDSWIKGKIDGDKVTFATDQYLGIYTTEMYYYFFQAADWEEGISEWGDPEIHYIPQPAVTLIKEGDKYVADKAMLMTFGMKTANPGMPSGSVLLKPTFAPYNEVPATPANPAITFVGEYYAPWGRSVGINIPATDTEGNFINPDNMYYNIFINGELFTFTPEVYAALTEPMTDIPYTFSETGVVVTNDGSADHTITLMMEETPVIEVQSAYTVNGETRKSAKVGTAGIETANVATPEVVTTEWYNLQGVRIDSPAAGTIAIRRDRLSDGSVKTAKIIR